MAVAGDSRWSLDDAPMHRRQILVVALCIALNALDGFDVLSISFAAPGIAADWGVDRATLGIVLSMELLGMALGSVAIGNLADRIGRRPTILGCLAVMAAGMFAAAAARDVTMLSATRFATGLGIGGMLSSTSAMVAEFSSARRRGLTMALNIAGYSAGVILGGSVAALLLGSGTWRSVFLLGGTATLVLLPVTAWALPESPASLLARRPANALVRLNALLTTLGRPALETLPPPVAAPGRPSLATLFGPVYSRSTILLTVAYFAQIMLFYFLQKWTPKIVVDMGYAQAEAGRVLVMANVGTMSGAIAIGLVAQRWPVRPAVTAAMAMGFVMIGLFGLGAGGSLTRLGLMAAVAGFFINAGVVGLYPILADTYPAAVRASGTGFVIGVGRGGSALGPIIAGAMFAAGSGLLPVSLAMGAGGLVAATMLLLLRPVRMDARATVDTGVRNPHAHGRQRRGKEGGA